MSIAINLSEKQESIVYADDRPLYVKASAGSGKTRVLTERIRYLLKTKKVKILALTFTNQAAEEIKERLREVPELQNHLFIGTFHGFCQYVLENHGNLIGLPKTTHIFEEKSDRVKLIEQAIQQTSFYENYTRKSKKDKKDFCDQVLQFIAQVKRELISEDSEEELLNKAIDENLFIVYQNYKDILTSQNAVDFDDLLLCTYNLFISFPKIASLYRRAYPYICVDEAQDLNNAQYQLLLALTGNEHKNIMLVADPNQSIYAFNGSSADYAEMNFRQDYTPNIIELTENYRSSKAVLKAANQIIPDSANVDHAVYEGLFEIHKFNDTQTEAKWIINKVNELIESQEHPDIEGEITYEKVAVLARNKYIFHSLETELRKNNIPFHYKMTLGSIKFESESIKIFDMALRVKLNPKDLLHWQNLLVLLKKPSISVIFNGKDDLHNLNSKLNSEVHKQILETVLGLKDDGSNLKIFLEKLQSFLQNSSSIQDSEKEMVFNDIEEILKHYHNYAKKTDNETLHQFKNAMALGQTHPLTQHQGITLSTVHTMKGQEFDIVILMGMDDETFPDYRAIKRGGAAMIQEKNNLYVAFTRAKRFLYVTWPQKRLMP
jgi:DNA helicase-2/ATP-dependent DNA helicase PcrA